RVRSTYLQGWVRPLSDAGRRHGEGQPAVLLRRCATRSCRASLRALLLRASRPRRRRRDRHLRSENGRRARQRRACDNHPRRGGTFMTTEPDELRDFARRYTEAWCSGDPVRVAEHYAADGSLTINGGTPSVGRAAITEAARSFMD